MHRSNQGPFSNIRKQCSTGSFPPFHLNIPRNQEDVERLKLALTEHTTLMASYASATEHSGHVIDSIQQTLLDLILMLQEVDEFIDDDGAGGGVRRRRKTSMGADEDGDFELADLLSGNVDDVQLFRVRRIST